MCSVLLEKGEWIEQETRWSQVKVGDVVKVHDNDLVPADLLCLHCEMPERICYVKTTNLDGETNLKVRRYDAS
jgi:P-type E1-E2 ATPase